MLKDRTNKILLATIAAGLWGVLLRPFVAAPSVQAQPAPAPAAAKPAKAAAVTAPNGEPIVISYEDKPLVIIHKGKISVWDVWDDGDGKHHLIHGDTKPLP